jgi:hypothetical protein
MLQARSNSGAYVIDRHVAGRLEREGDGTQPRGCEGRA